MNSGKMAMMISIIMAGVFVAPSVALASGYYVFLVDVTGSMSLQRHTGNSRLFDAITEAKDDLQTFVPDDGTSMMAVWYFTSSAAGGYAIQQHWTTDKPAIDAVLAVGPGGGTPLADAMCEGAEELKQLTTPPVLNHN